MKTLTKARLTLKSLHLILLASFLLMPLAINGQIVTVEYNNNEEEEFVGVLMNVTYSIKVNEQTSDNYTTILCGADKDLTMFGITTQVVKNGIEGEVEQTYQSSDKKEALQEFREVRDSWCAEFPSYCEEIKNEFGNFIKFLSK